MPGYFLREAGDNTFHLFLSQDTPLEVDDTIAIYCISENCITDHLRVAEFPYKEGDFDRYFSIIWYPSKMEKVMSGLEARLNAHKVDRDRPIEWKPLFNSR